MEGWISLYRQIRENWIWKSKEPFDKRSAWIDLLLRANHKDTKILLNNKLIEVKKGSFITSELTLADDWKWSRKKVRNFLQGLETDKMLSKKSTTKDTTITITNWELYQFKEQQKNNKRTTEEQQGNTDNNDNNVNNIYYINLFNKYKGLFDFTQSLAEKQMIFTKNCINDEDYKKLSTDEQTKLYSSFLSIF